MHRELVSTVLDTFFVPFYYTKNTRTDELYNHNQRLIIMIIRKRIFVVQYTITDPDVYRD